MPQTREAISHIKAAGVPIVAGAPKRCSTSGTATVPASSWKFSMMDSSARAVAPVPFSVCTNSSLPSRRNLMLSRRAW